MYVFVVCASTGTEGTAVHSHSVLSGLLTILGLCIVCVVVCVCFFCVCVDLHEKMSRLVAAPPSKTYTTYANSRRHTRLQYTHLNSDLHEKVSRLVFMSRIWGLDWLPRASGMRASICQSWGWWFCVSIVKYAPKAHKAYLAVVVCKLCL